MKRLLLPLLLWPVAVSAQDDETARDRSFIVGFLEDNLSGAGRDIRIDGFRGVLSSRASLDRLTIADEDGIWFVLEGAELDWDRSALLSGRLEVRELSADKIELLRLPAPAAENTPSPEAEPFSFALPELPVSISIDALSAPNVRLGADILGLGAPIDFDIAGQAQLAEGAGEATLDISRTSGIDGRFALAAQYDNLSRQLTLDLSLEEEAGGIAASLMGLPDSPPLALTLRSDAPIDDFVADLAFATDGTDRFAGTLKTRLRDLPAETSTQTPRIRDFSADLSGDVSPLFTADYAKFFGQTSSLAVRGTRFDTGALTLDQLTLTTRALTLFGAVDLAPDGLPERFSLAGFLAQPDRDPVLLPLSGARTEVDRASFTAQYDRAAGDIWRLGGTLERFARDDIVIDQIDLEGQGTIARNPTPDLATLLSEVTARVTADARGIAPRDARLARALGEALTLSANIAWQEGTPLTLNSFTAATDGAEVAMAGTLDGLESGLAFVGNARAQIADLTRIAPLTGLDLQGGGIIDLDGRVHLADGRFDLDGALDATALRFGIPRLDALLGRASTLHIAAARDENGLTLRQARLATDALQAEAQGQLSTDAGDLTLSARLDNVARLDTGLTGPLSLDGRATRAGGGDWSTDVSLVGPGGSRATLAGQIAADATRAALAISGTAPLGLANSLTTAALVQGTADFDLRLDGPLALTALSGRVGAAGARVVINGTRLAFDLPRAGLSLSGGRAQIDATAQAETGGEIAISGGLALTGGLVADLTLRPRDLVLTDPALYRTSLTGDLRLQGPLAGGARLGGALTLGQTDVTVNPAALGDGDDMLDITHRGATADVTRTRDRAGLIARGGDAPARPIALDLTVSAPNRIFVRGRGLDAEMGGQLGLRGTTADVIPVGQFNLIRGRLSLLGTRIDMQEGTLALRGDLDPTVRLVAGTTVDDLAVSLTLAGRLSSPELTLASQPDLPDEEILSRLLFGRAVTQISPLQAARMAAAISTLTGGGGGLVGSIRNSFGLDDLDLQTEEDGSAALKLGKYLSEQVYTDVTIGADGRSEINLNLDATPNITIKGGVSSDGETGLGVFFEKDY